MKPKFLLFSLMALLLLVAVGLASARIAGFALPWWTVDSGGGTSTGTGYKLNGTIGQPDAGPLSGGNFKLTGGFWVIASPPPYLYLPLTLRDPFMPACGPANSYCEDNDSVDEAYGPLRPGASYSAYPDDIYDFYFINLPTSATVTFQVTHYQTRGQLQVLNANKVSLETDASWDDQVLTIVIDLSPGKYYIYINTEEDYLDPTDLYTLKVTY
jgi:hypothetical protein